MNTESHFTRHAEGEWSLIHQGQPLCKPGPLASAQETAKRYKLEIDAVWVANKGEFVRIDPVLN